MKHSDIRNHIIQTASDLFYGKGYNSTGINEIISTAGIAKATLYNHFKSKEDICLTFLQHKNEVFLKEIKLFCIEQKPGSSQVIALFDFLHNFFKSETFNGCWCINTVAEIPKDNVKIKKEIQHQKLLFLKFITSLIRNNMQNYTEEEIQTKAKQIYLLYESAVAESHLHDEAWPILEAKKMTTRFIG